MHEMNTSNNTSAISCKTLQDVITRSLQDVAKIYTFACNELWLQNYPILKGWL